MNDFEEYIRQGEPQKKEKGYAWQTAIGLQAVDDLKPSEYLIQTARKHIEGDITIEEAKQLIDTYYQSKTARSDMDDRTEEADSWYFRNALVRANYNNLSKGIYATTEYIEAFFRNLILSKHNELKNRTMLIQESSPQERQSANATNEMPPKCNICTLNCTLLAGTAQSHTKRKCV